MADQELIGYDRDGKPMYKKPLPVQGAGGRSGGPPPAAPSGGGRAGGAGGATSSTVSNEPPAGMDFIGYDPTGKPIFKKKPDAPKAPSDRTRVRGPIEGSIDRTLQGYFGPAVNAQTVAGAAKSLLAPVEYGGKLLRKIPYVNELSAIAGEAQLPFNSEPTNTDQRVGRTVGDVAVSLVPGARATSAVKTIAQAAPRGLQALTRIGGEAVTNAGLSYLQGDSPTTGAVFGAGGEVVGKGLEKIAPHLMEGALRINAPIARKFGRYGELGETALEHRIMPTQKGAEKAEHLAMLEQAYKEKMLRETLGDNLVPVKPIADRAAASLRPHQELNWKAGLDPADVVKEPEVITRFRQRAPADDLFSTARPVGKIQGMESPGGFLGPRGYGPHGGFDGAKGPYQRISFTPMKGQAEYAAHELDAIKGKLDNEAEAWHRAMQQGQVGADAQSKTASALSREIHDDLAVRSPQYAGFNDRIMNLKGVQYAAQGRADIPAGKLGTTLAVLNPGWKSMIGRALLAPEIVGGAAIAANETGKKLTRFTPAMRAAILQGLLGGGG